MQEIEKAMRWMKKGPISIRYISMLLLSLCLLISPVYAADVIELGQPDVPRGAVILIIDGLGSSYIYPEFTPYALDGSALAKADVPNMSYIMDQSCRVLDVRAPKTYTEAGHSVLVTGYTQALSDLVGSYGTTIYDTAHNYGLYTFGVMQKGDSSGMCSKHDVIIHDTSNSVNSPNMMVKTNIRSTECKHITLEVAKVMQDTIPVLKEDLELYPEGSGQRYDVYDNWAINTAMDVIDHMQINYPKQGYLLTINVGGVDSAGHHKKDKGYIESIEGIDAACMELYEKCKANDLLFIFTADHGMTFSSPGSKGGHQAAKYSKTKESQRVPLLISASSIENTVLMGSYGQEDIAPTLMELLYLPNELRSSDGKAIPLRNDTVLKISPPERGKVELLRGEDVIFTSMVDDICLLRGVSTGHNYKLRFTSENGKSKEKDFFLEEALHIDLSSTVVGKSSFFNERRHIIGCGLIVVVNVIGLLLIRRLLRE